MRASSTTRLYDARWRKESKAFLRRHPDCEFCRLRGKLVPSRIVDHRIPHRGNPTLFWDKTNWQAMCKPCHDGAKQKQEATGRIIGCDEQGNPLDPSRGWQGQQGRQKPHVSK